LRVALIKVSSTAEMPDYGLQQMSRAELLQRVMPVINCHV